MSSINSIAQMDRSRLSLFGTRSIQGMMIHDGVTGLNPKGDYQFRKRVNELMKENGLPTGPSFGKNGEGKFILLQNHPDKAKIEGLLNSDEKLKQIRNDPAHTFDTSKGGTFSTNGYDSAYFSEQAKKMYEESQKNGATAPYASSAEDTAAVMEWAANKKVILISVPGEEIPTIQSGISFQAAMEAKPLNPEDVASLKSDKIHELTKIRAWLETEIASLLEKRGVDSKNLQGIKFSFGGEKIGVLPGQEGVSEELAETISGIINSPEHTQLKSIMNTYRGEVASVASELQKVTGLNETDWAEVMAGGGNLADVDNSGMKALLASDPELATALNSLFGGGSGLLAKTQSVSSSDAANDAARGLGVAINSVLAGGEAFGLTKQEIESIKKNLVVEVNSDGTYKIGGTNNSKFNSVIEGYISHYMSGEFGRRIQSGLLLNQALGNGDAGNGLSFVLSYRNGKLNGTVKYGDGEAKLIKGMV